MASTKRKASGELVSPLHKQPHLDEYDGNDQRLPHKSSQSLAPRTYPPAILHGRTVPRSLSASPVRRPSRPSDSPAVTDKEVVEAAEGAHDALLSRIQASIDYVREQQSKGEAIKQSTRFELTTTSQSRASNLLRRFAAQICASATHEVYELGVPRPDWVTAGILPGLHDPQWWLDKTTAEVKAGPWAEEHDVKRAAANLKGLQTRKNKKKGPTAREKEIEWKLKEGIRRQEKKLRMYDTDSESTEEESESEEHWEVQAAESE
ncbi:Nn.00g103820.m01.CDS01 [Neocucurbitaria sp. VM-36]